MAAKFIKQTNESTSKEEWVVEITCESSGTKQPESGDILTMPNRRKVKLTDIVSTSGDAGVRGSKTVARFTNF
jgi:hypothetical protein